MKHGVWDDGRTGAAGRLAGNIALEDLARKHGPWRKVKGTVFESARELVIGRVCSSDDYLTAPIVHWANGSWDQHVELQNLAGSRGNALNYLFVTATRQPPTVTYWHVPAPVVEAEFIARGRNAHRSTCALHIIADGDRNYLGKGEVTAHRHVVVLDDAGSVALARAFARGGARASALPSSRRTSRAARGDVANSYAIPVSGGRAVTVQIPGPLSAADVSRFRSWIDLTEDVLTEGSDEPASDAQRQWLRDAIELGRAQLARGDTVDGEAAFDRILSHGQRHARRR
jgi:hypothetical protein